MNGDKRRKARVQGGWAAPSQKQSGINKTKHLPLAAISLSEPKTEAHCYSDVGSRETLASTRSASSKAPAQTLPVWTRKSIDQPAQSNRKFVFEDPEEEMKMKPPDKVITKPGVYDISEEPSGISRLRYFPQFVDLPRSDEIFAELLEVVPWKQRSEVHSGALAIQPRLTAWYSELPYTYSGITVEANTSEWPSALNQLRQQLEVITGVEFNSVAANLYRDGHDSIGWHSDDEPIMGKNPTIASLSFGEERMFELRKKPAPNESGERDYTYSQVIKIPLQSGSLLIMEGWTQSDWQHRVPKEYHDRGARINLTFRVAKPVHT